MSVEAMTWVFNYSPYKGVGFAVHLAIADTVNDGYEMLFWMRLTKLARRVRANRSTVVRVVKEMIDDGLLEVVEDNSRNGRDNPNTYRFVIREDLALYYDKTTTDGAPGSFPEHKYAISARQHQLRQQRERFEEGNPSLFAAEQTSLIDVPSDGAEQEVPESGQFEAPNVPSAQSDSEEDVVEGKVEPDVPTPEEMQRRYEQFPDGVVSGSEIGGQVQSIIAYYVSWRRSQGIGDLAAKRWHGIIGDHARRLMKEGFSPKAALDAVIRWHDTNVDMQRRGKDDLNPGAIYGMAVRQTQGTSVHGRDGNGQSDHRAMVNRLFATAKGQAGSELPEVESVVAVVGDPSDDDIVDAEIVDDAEIVHLDRQAG